MGETTDIVKEPIKGIFTQFFKNREKKKEHDKKNFEKSNSILSEDELGNIVNYLETNHSYLRNNGSKIYDYFNYFEKIGNQYILKKNKKSLSKFLESLKKLRRYMSKEFDIMKRSHNHECHHLHPELNIDKDADWDEHQQERDHKYNEYLNRLYKLIDEVNKDYKGYRESIKKTIFI